MRVKEENTREYWEARLADDEAQLKDLEERGIEALSSYDRSFGDLEQKLKTAKWLKGNHIAYARKQLDQFRQASLF